MFGVDPESVKHALTARILDLARLVIPDGHIEGREWIGHGPDGSKWGIVISGRKAGRYQNFGAGRGGLSPLGLVRDAVCAGDHRRAFAWARDFLGDEPLPPQPSCKAAATSRAEQEQAAPTGLRLFLSAGLFAWSTPVGAYLAGRGLGRVHMNGESLAALRYLPSCWNSDTGTNFAAMVAAVINPDTRRHQALHRTYLARDAAGVWRKAPVPRPKKLIGSPVGGVIPLTRGRSGRPLRDAPAGDAAVIAEGIENALTGWLLYPERRALAAISAGNLARIVLPQTIGDILLMRDRDGENPGVNQSRVAAVARWTDEGRAVSQWEPPDGYKDANAWWTAVLSETSK